MLFHTKDPLGLSSGPGYYSRLVDSLDKQRPGELYSLMASSAVETVNKAYHAAPESLGEGELETRRKILANLQPLRNSEISPFEHLRALVGESQFEDLGCIETKFENFLAEAGLASVSYKVKKVVYEMAFAQVHGKPIWTHHDISIKDAQDLVEVGAVSKLDGFQDEFKLAIAEKLFA